MTNLRKKRGSASHAAPCQLMREEWLYGIRLIRKRGHAHFFSHKSANPQVLGLIPLSQICKSLGCFRGQVPTPQFSIIFLFNPQITNLQISLVFQSPNCASANFSPKVNECHTIDGKAQVSKSVSGSAP